MTISEIIAARLPAETAASMPIGLYAAEAEQKVRNYCNFLDNELLPAALSYVAANMALDLIRLEPSNQEDAVGPVKSVAMGDVSYSFDTTSGRAVLDRLLLNYESDLKKYRRVRR